MSLDDVIMTTGDGASVRDALVVRTVGWFLRRALIEMLAEKGGTMGFVYWDDDVILRGRRMTVAAFDRRIAQRTMPKTVAALRACIAAGQFPVVVANRVIESGTVVLTDLKRFLSELEEGVS